MFILVREFRKFVFDYQRVAVSFSKIMKAHALDIHFLLVLGRKALLPRRLRLTSEPSHLALLSVDLSKLLLIYLVTAIMHRAR